MRKGRDLPPALEPKPKLKEPWIDRWLPFPIDAFLGISILFFIASCSWHFPAWLLSK